MYRITVRNTVTGIKFYEYGFSRDMMKRIHFLFHETDNDGYSIYDILDITILAFSLKTFKKCLTNYTTLQYNKCIKRKRGKNYDDNLRNRLSVL